MIKQLLDNLAKAEEQIDGAVDDTFSNDEIEVDAIEEVAEDETASEDEESKPDEQGA